MLSQKNSLKEIEIKLYANNKILNKIYKHPLFTQYSNPTWHQKELFNQYIDTADHALTRAKVALRVRKDGEQYIQTLKTQGQSVGGLSERDEFDWVLESSKLDLSLLQAAYWPEILEKLDKSSLNTIFSTDFTRHYALFTWQKNHEKAQIEVAIDKGFVKAQQKQESISELELELREGSAEVMLDFAIELSKLFPLIPSDTSKAERGYRLITSSSYKLQTEKKQDFNDPYECLNYYLAASQRLWESYLWQPEKTKLIKWEGLLQQLSNLFQRLGIKHLMDLIDEILVDWHEVASLSSKQLEEKVSQELAKTRWGFFSLSTSHWLLSAH